MKKTMLALALMLISNGWADEGMWQPHQLPELETVLKSKGLQIDAASIAQLTTFPMNAVISLGGCTASFISNQGLAVTNHHCAAGAIQLNSTPDNNLLDKEYFSAGRLGVNPFSPSIHGAIGPDGYNHNSSDWLSTLRPPITTPASCSGRRKPSSRIGQTAPKPSISASGRRSLATTIWH